jgi:sphingomyelin phosphodiesterase acid-like 3
MPNSAQSSMPNNSQSDTCQPEIGPTVGQHQNHAQKFLLLEPRKFLNRLRQQPPANPLQSKSTRAILKPYGMIVVYFALGNDDSPCGDYATDVQGLFLRTLADSLQVLRSHPEALGTFRVGGFYELAHPTLSDEEILVLNTILWSPLSFSCRSNAPDPGQTEMQWLEARLHDARTSAKKVILVMHIPPGIDVVASSQAGYGKPATLFWRDIYLDQFQALVRNYGDLVKIGVAGHTHMDEFRVLANADPSKTVAFRITPAISPIYKNNPAFSILKYNIKTGDILDIDTYYLDLAKSVQPQRWNNEYSFSNAYGYLVFNSENLLALAARIRNDSELRDVYDRYYSALAPLQINSENWPFYSCAQTTFTRQDFEKSVESLRNDIERPAE